MSEYVRTWQDNGGVHTLGYPKQSLLSGSHKHWWLSLGNGRSHSLALISPTLSPRATFRQFARETIMAASDLFGPNSAEQQAAKAMHEAGVTVARAGLAAE